jgi:hypothetical protein
MFVMAPVAWADAPTSDRSISVHAGAYRLIDRADGAFDGPEIALGARAPLGRSWGLVGHVGAAGEFAGGAGTCLGLLTARVGPSFALHPGPEWLRLDVAAGAGLAFARVYGSLFGATDPMLVAHGDRLLPELWSSLGLSVRLFADWTASLDLVSRWVPRATFHADALPAGMSSDFYPTFRRAHDLSTLGGMLGLAYRF